MKRTPLYEEHRRLGARMIPFGLWEMPERYAGTIAEHRATRTAVGLFDLSHMGEFSVSGTAAMGFITYLLTNSVATLEPDAALYSPMCRDDGGIIDDVIVYRLSTVEPQYLLVVNCSNIEKDWAWITAMAERLGVSKRVTIEDQSERTALLAVQGPAAQLLMDSLVPDSLTLLLPFHAVASRIDGIAAYIARTGYTGEDGFEVLVPSEDATRLWRLLLERGASHGILPVGLAARDTLRLEARLALYGNDIDETTTPLEAGLRRWVSYDHDFCGRPALARIIHGA